MYHQPILAPQAPGNRALAGSAETRSTSRVSRAIGLSRVLCILGIVYVHAWTGLYGPALTALDDSGQGLLRWGLIELLGRSSVPLLSMISGWLIAPSLARRGARAFLVGKVRTVLVPMVLWNLLAIAIVSGAARLGWLYAPQPQSWGWVANEVSGLWQPNEINVQMPFLRDLFVCLLFAPLLVRVSDRMLWLVVLGSLAWSFWPGAFPLLQRPTILAFLVIGLLARRHDMAQRAGHWPLRLVVLPYLGMATAKVWLEVFGAGAGIDRPILLELVDLAMRGATALCFWALAWRLADRKLGALLLRAEPVVFLMFCAHLILIWCGGPAIGALTGPMGARAYPLFLLAQPVLVLGATLLLARALQAASPSLAGWLSGGRLGGGRPNGLTAPDRRPGPARAPQCSSRST